MKLFTSILLCFLISFAALAQKKSKNYPPVSFSGNSEDGRYFVLNTSIKRFLNGEFTHLNVAKVYHVRSRRYIAKFELTTPVAPKELSFSPDNKKLIVKAGKGIWVFDIKRRTLQKQFPALSAIGFLDGHLAYPEGGQIKLIDGELNTPFKLSYQGFGKDALKKIAESPNYQLVLGKSAHNLYIWQKGQTTLKNKILCSQFQFSPDGTKLYVLSYKNRLCYFSIFDSKTFQLLEERNSEQYQSFNDYNFSDGSSISPDGEYMAFCGKKFNETKVLGIYQIESNKLSLELDSIKLEVDFASGTMPYKWSKNQEIIIRTEYEKGAVFNVKQGSLVTKLDFNHSFKKYQIGPTARTLISFGWSSSSRIAMHFPADYGKSSIRIYDSKFLSFEPENRLIFVEKTDKKSGFLILDELAQGKVKFYPFSTVPYVPGKEDVIEEDSANPEWYSHTYMKGFRHISELPEGANLKLHYKSTVKNNKNIGLQAHLIDNEGYYYYGASENMWRDWWCNLRVKQKGETVFTEIDSFFISETSEIDTLPLALALVMDHSGSMGEDRALTVQEAVQKFIKEKRSEDTVALIKYDSKIIAESPLEKDTALLLKRLKMDGLQNYGGATALIDAGHEAVEILKKAVDYEKKAILIFTDGYENSSVLTQSELIAESGENNTQIYTIGFGSATDSAFLKQLAEETAGGYYEIYQTEDFMRIFEDVYSRMRNYYTIQFPTDTIGEFEAILDLCLPDGKDSLRFEFFNDTIVPTFIVEDIPEDQFTDFEKTPEKGDIKLLNITFDFATTNITESSEPEVQKAIDYMKKYPSIKIELRGHTDYVGSDHYNLKLSKQRAHAIRQLMIKNGIAHQRILTKGLGESSPIANNETEEGRAMNRRTEFVILEE